MAIPLHKFATLDPSLVAGKLVIDVMNYPSSVYRCAGPSSS